MNENCDTANAPRILQMVEQGQALDVNLEVLSKNLSDLYERLRPILSDAKDFIETKETVGYPMAPHASFLFECNMKIKKITDGVEELRDRIEI